MCTAGLLQQEKEPQQNLFSTPSQTPRLYPACSHINTQQDVQINHRGDENRGCFQMSDFPSDAERREEICSTRFPADAWQQGNECCLCQPLPGGRNGSLSPCSEAACLGTMWHGVATQLSIKNGLVCARRAGEHLFTTCAVAGDCRHHFCSVSKTAAPSCHQVLTEEEYKTH